jgi:hypothetical protein
VGFALDGADGHGDNIVFVDGRYFYLVGIGGSDRSPTQNADVLAAAQALYADVQGR